MDVTVLEKVVFYIYLFLHICIIISYMWVPMLHIIIKV